MPPLPSWHHCSCSANTYCCSSANTCVCCCSLTPIPGCQGRPSEARAQQLRPSANIAAHSDASALHMAYTSVSSGPPTLQQRSACSEQPGASDSRSMQVVVQSSAPCRKIVVHTSCDGQRTHSRLYAEGWHHPVMSQDQCMLKHARNTLA